MGSTVNPYQIAVPDAAIEKLKTKLSLATFPGETTFSNDWNYGAPLDDIKRLADVWQNKFDWRRAEAELNKLPQFTTTISVEGHEDALEIHFIHQKSDNPKSIPLLFCHGWPGSFIEVIKMLPLLTSSSKDEQPTFHVVAPSLPNYGFSQRTSKPGFALPQYAEVCHKLMLQLGYEKYVTQAGDLGFFVTRIMGVQYPSHVLASHMNFVFTAPPSPLSSPLLCLQHVLGRYTPAEKAGLERAQWYNQEGSGYSKIQTTKPHTPGFALADSPVALLAWVYEKLRDWTDAYPWTDDEILTWVSIYAFSAAGPDASLRVYYEISHAQAATADGQSKGNPSVAAFRWNKIPLGRSCFPKDVMVVPSSWGRTLGPVVFEKWHGEGGHFASYEKPELLVDDLRKMFGKDGGVKWQGN
ncbi:alpha/beta-hydrolase [Xylariaceae sp. FL0662B]|nr:alpha/beta-hydrolase [Xylariaceae sp. FL0662B]